MGPRALQFINAVARKLLVPKGKGITSIANRMQAEAKAGEIAETFRLSGLTPDKWDDFIKSEADVKKYLNIIESSKPKGPTIRGHRIISGDSPEGKKITEDLFGKKGNEWHYQIDSPEGKRFMESIKDTPEGRDMLKSLIKSKAIKPKADVFDLTGKKIDTSKPILGGKNVPESINLSKYDDAALNALVDEDTKLLAEANKLSEAGENYGRVKAIEVRRKEIKEILKAAQDVPPSGYDNFKADIAAKKQTDAQIKAKLEKQNKEAINRLKDKMKDKDPEDFAYGGLAGMLGEPTYMDDALRVPYKDAKLVEGETYFPPKNFYSLGLGPLLNEFMSEGRPRDEEGFHTTLNKNDLINLWNYLKEDQDIDIEDELMFRFGRFNPDKNSMLHIGIGKDKKEIGFKKKFNEGGRVPYSKGSSPEVLPADFDELDHDELMHIIKLLQAGEIPKLADGGRIGFGAGGIDKMRRLFLQATGAGAAGVGAAKSGLFGLLKSSKSAVVKDLTQVPIKNAEGMPSWFKPLVNRVIKEGTDITKLPPNKGGAYLDRQIVHSAKLGEGQGVKVYQNLDDQTIRVEYHSADNMGGVDDGIVHLEYKAAEEIPMDNEVFKNLPKGKSSVKTKPTFEANEAYPLQDSKDYKTITFEGDNTVKNVDDLFSDTSALKQFATGKNLSKKELAIAKQKQKQVKKIHDNPSEELAGSGPDYDDYDFASGGRVPFKGGKKVLEGLAKLFDEFFPGTTKVGQTSKPVAKKTELRRALADFQERQCT